MSRNEPTELLVAVHYDPPEGRAIRISIDGENSKAKWIAKSLIGSFHLTGKSTRGTESGRAERHAAISQSSRSGVAGAARGADLR